MSSFYPLKAGNSWTYKLNDGSTFTNKVDSDLNGSFLMSNTTVSNQTQLKKEGNLFFTDSYEAGNMQPFLKDDANAGDTWEIKYKVNGIDSILNVVVKSVDGTVDVEGKEYQHVMEMEGMMSFNVNGSIINAGTKYRWFYSKGVGLVLTTSTVGDHMPLVSFFCA